MQWQNHCQYSSSGMFKQCQQCQDKQTHPFNGPFPGLPRWASTRKVKPSWILLKQETLSGSGISCAIYKSAPCSRQITTPAPHHSLFYTPDALLATQPTASKRSRHNVKTNLPCNIFLVVGTGNRSAPMQSHSAASRLAISNAKILIYLSNKIYGSNFIKKLRPINGGKNIIQPKCPSMHWKCPIISLGTFQPLQWCKKVTVPVYLTHGKHIYSRKHSRLRDWCWQLWRWSGRVL